MTGAVWGLIVNGGIAAWFLYRRSYPWATWFCFWMGLCAGQLVEKL